MKNRFKSKKKRDLRVYVYILLFTLSFISTLKLLVSDKFFTKDYLLTNLLNENTNKEHSLIKKINEELTDPKYIIYNGLNKIVEKDNLSVFANIDNDNFDYDNVQSEYVSDPEPSTPEKPIVYIYNTHQLEEYSSLTPYDYSVKPNVMIASYIMREKLKDNGISSVVETNNVKEYLNNNNLSYNKSYLATERFARSMKSTYPSIKYMVDLHRDSIDYDKSYAEINGKGYAKIMILTGYEHTKDNEGFASNLNNIINEKYPGLSRGVINRDGILDSGGYNSDIEGKSVLIEVGGVDNKIEEVYNSVEAISICLSELIKGEL